MRWMVWRRRVYRAAVRRDLRVLALVVSAAALLLMVEGLELRLRPVALALTEAQLQNRVTAVVEETLSSQPEAAALLTVQRGSDGRVLSGTADMAAANRLRSQVAAALLAEFQSQTHTVAIPAGSLLGADAPRSGPVRRDDLHPAPQRAALRRDQSDALPPVAGGLRPPDRAAAGTAGRDGRRDPAVSGGGSDRRPSAGRLSGAVVL